MLEEFPKTNASEIAYRRKLFTLLGWKEAGRDGESYGAFADFRKYIPQILETFTSYEKDFPEVSICKDSVIKLHNPIGFKKTGITQKNGYKL